VKISQLYNLTARHYNIKPKNIVRYNSIVSVEDSINNGAINNYFKPNMVGDLTGLNPTRSDDITEPLFYGQVNCGFILLSAITNNVKMSLNPFDIIKIDPVSGYTWTPIWMF